MRPCPYGLCLLRYSYHSASHAPEYTTSISTAPIKLALSTGLRCPTSLEHVAGLRTRSHLDRGPRLPFKLHALPTKTKPPKVFPRKVARARKASRNPSGQQFEDISVAATSTEKLEEELAWLANNNPASRDIGEIFDELVKERGVKPSALHYEALILSNCDPENGSAENMKALLEEMLRHGLSRSASTYAAVLQVLAIHPDPAMREQILQEMKSRWIAVSPEMEHAITAALIREGQLEVARGKIFSLKAPVWLYVLYMHALCQKDDFDAILRMMYKLSDRHIDLPRATWWYLLQQASRHGHFEVTLRIWLRHVETMYIIPDVHCCVRVLELASRKAHPKLAESAMVVLEDRYPKEASQRKELVQLAYKNAKETPNPAKYRKGNMFALLSETNGYDGAYFDPKIAIAMRPLLKFSNPKHIARKERMKLMYKQKRPPS